MNPLMGERKLKSLTFTISSGNFNQIDSGSNH